MADDPRVGAAATLVLSSGEVHPRAGAAAVLVLARNETSIPPDVGAMAVLVLGKRYGRRVLTIIGGPDANQP